MPNVGVWPNTAQDITVIRPAPANTRFINVGPHFSSRLIRPARAETESGFLVLTWPLDVIDHKNVNGPFAGLELQSELLLQRGKDRGTGCVAGDLAVIAGRNGIGRPAQGNVESVFETSTVYDFPFQDCGQQIGKGLHGCACHSQCSIPDPAKAAEVRLTLAGS